MRKIRSKAPTRVDLAGGTVDIWPIYLFLDRPTTLNLGISLFAEAEIDEVPGGPGVPDVLLRADDQGKEMFLKWDDFLTHGPMPAGVPPQLELHFKLLRYFAQERKRSGRFDPKVGVKLSTRAKSPAGAGLGGSSALSVAMIGALAKWSRDSIDVMKDGEKFIEITRDVETTVIHVPAGMQDYYGAMFGGLQALRWREGSNAREWLPESLLPEVQDRLLLFYSGQSRNSGINNWALFKSFIDKQDQVRERFAQIAKATADLEAALLKKDWMAASQAIDAEWSVRRTLAAGISTPEMDQAFLEARRLAKDAGNQVVSGKICGAGGGGCFFIFVPSGDPVLKKKIQEKIASETIRVLPFEASQKGLVVEQTTY
ncbi:MAG: hypothetical protein JNL01_06475 [Bdellovibrionales bacterium]|nr:hypothetical protein [Bdellovibrionales bacterium]